MANRVRIPYLEDPDEEMRMKRKRFEFHEYRRKRQEACRSRYTLPNGENKSLYRDNLHDVLEELADAVNILNLWLERISEREYKDDLGARLFATRAVGRISRRLVQIAREVYNLRSIYRKSAVDEEIGCPRRLVSLDGD